MSAFAFMLSLAACEARAQYRARYARTVLSFARFRAARMAGLASDDALHAAVLAAEVRP